MKDLGLWLHDFIMRFKSTYDRVILHTTHVSFLECNKDHLTHAAKNLVRNQLPGCAKKIHPLVFTLCDRVWLWLGEMWLLATWDWFAGTKPLLGGPGGRWCLVVAVVIWLPAVWKWLLGVEGREFVGVGHVAGAVAKRCWTIFWHAARGKHNETLIRWQSLTIR